jgi:hypothetical protein
MRSRTLRDHAIQTQKLASALTAFGVRPVRQLDTVVHV